MDAVTIEKLQAMKRYRRRGSLLRRTASFVMSMISIGLFLSSPLWLPRLYSFLRYLLLVGLPATRDALLSPRCLFVVCNIIVALLLHGTKSRGSGTQDIYEEYAKRNKCTNSDNIVKEVEEEEEEEEEELAQDGGAECVCMDDVSEEDNDDNDDDDEGNMEAEELKKKVEDFIARVNHQRRLEERMLIAWG